MLITGEVSTIAGLLNEENEEENEGKPWFSSPMGIFFDDEKQTLLVCDSLSDKLLSVSQFGM